MDLAELAREAVQPLLSRVSRVPRVAAAAKPRMVQANPERLTTVIEHVIRNAQDATSAERVGERSR